MMDMDVAEKLAAYFDDLLGDGSGLSFIMGIDVAVNHPEWAEAVMREANKNLPLRHQVYIVAAQQDLVLKFPAR